MKKVTVVGHIAMDFIFSIPYFPEKNYSIYIKKMGKYFGGGAANIAVGISKLGCRSEIISAVPKNFSESKYGRYLKENNVDLCVAKFNEKIAQAYIFNDEKKNQITYFYWGVSEKMDEMEGIAREYVHIAPSHPSLATKMAEKGKYVAYEPGQDLPKWNKEGLSYVLEKVAVLFCNNFELKEIERKVGMKKEALVKHMDIIVTKGKEGSIVYTKDKKISIPVVPAEIVDPTGAGDAYKAAFWAGLMKGYDMETACKMGSTAASMVVEKMGAQNGLPNWKTLCQKYQQHFGDIENI
ncbi:sugar kinase [Thermoplasmatales archaeon ex4484_30]|nr:MAG: sugar kinase [Thermoplasmatales archaeon ex4484_30]